MEGTSAQLLKEQRQKKTRKRKEPSKENIATKGTKKLKKQVTQPTVKKNSQNKEFWIKLFTTSSGVRVVFSDEALGPFKTKEEAVKAVNEKVEEIENDYGIVIPEEDFLEDRRDKPPARGQLLVIKNDREQYHFQISTKKPKIFDGNDSDTCPF